MALPSYLLTAPSVALSLAFLLMLFSSFYLGESDRLNLFSSSSSCWLVRDKMRIYSRLKEKSYHEVITQCLCRRDRNRALNVGLHISMLPWKKKKESINVTLELSLVVLASKLVKLLSLCIALLWALGIVLKGRRLSTVTRSFQRQSDAPPPPNCRLDCHFLFLIFVERKWKLRGEKRTKKKKTTYFHVELNFEAKHRLVGSKGCRKVLKKSVDWCPVQSKYRHMLERFETHLHV